MGSILVWFYTARNAQVAASLPSPSRYQMRSHRLLRLDDNKSVIHVVNGLAATSCELHAGLVQVVSSTCSISLQISSCSKSDVHRLDATW